MNSGFNPLTNHNMNLASGVYATYVFVGETDSIPDPTSITNLIGTGEVYDRLRGRLSWITHFAHVIRRDHDARKFERLRTQHDHVVKLL